jgi:hypothetical protein
MRLKIRKCPRAPQEGVEVGNGLPKDEMKN